MYSASNTGTWIADAVRIQHSGAVVRLYGYRDCAKILFIRVLIEVPHDLHFWCLELLCVVSFAWCPEPNPISKTTCQRGRDKNINRKHINISLTALAGQSSQGRTPTPSQGQNGDFTVELNRERLVCARDGSKFVPEKGPVSRRDGSCLSRTLSSPECLCLLGFFHVYLNSVQQMVSGELAGKGLQTGFSRHCLPPQRALLDTVYPLRKHLNSVQRMVSGGYCEGSFPDTVCWTRLRNTWFFFARVTHIKPRPQAKPRNYTCQSALRKFKGIAGAISGNLREAWGILKGIPGGRETL